MSRPASLGLLSAVLIAAWMVACTPESEVTPGPAVNLYELQLDLTGFTPHKSQLIEARVVDEANQLEVARVRATGDDQVTLFFGEVLIEGRSYRIDFYADHDHSDEYTPPVGDPPTAWPDHQWRITAETDAPGAAGLANVSSDVRITFAHNVNFTDIDWPGKEANSGVATYPLTLQLTGFNPHTGQLIEARLIDLADGSEVTRTRAIGAANVTLDFGRVLEGGHSYQIDFYADHDRDGKYTPPVGDPPTAWPDHQWRITAETDAPGAAGLANVSDAVRITFAHNVNFTNIAWPE